MVAAELPTRRQHAWLVAAQHGDHRAFERLVAAHMHELHLHCYRILGSLHDADDATQETIVRAWRALPRFGGRRLLRPWLYKIAANVCINMSERSSRRVLSLDASPDDRL